jgi:indole-3-glycerol phosphate synthase
VKGSRRFSQAISEGDGISVLVEARDAEAARAAERDGAEAIVLRAPNADVRGATELPILWCVPDSLADASRAEADAYLLTFEDVADEEEQLEHLVMRVRELGMDCVVDVRDEEELEGALERVDPEIVLLSGRDGDELEKLEHMLELLPDVPAGKLAIAELRDARRDDVVELERAGFDAVIVGVGDVAELVGGAPPEV